MERATCDLRATELRDSGLAYYPSSGHRQKDAHAGLCAQISGMDGDMLFVNFSREFVQECNFGRILHCN